MVHLFTYQFQEGALDCRAGLFPLVRYGWTQTPFILWFCHPLWPHPSLHPPSRKRKTARRGPTSFFTSLPMKRYNDLPLPFCCPELLLWPLLRQRKLENVVKLCSQKDIKSWQSLPHSLSLKEPSVKDFFWPHNSPVKYTGKGLPIFTDLKFKKIRNGRTYPKLLMIVVIPGPQIRFSSSWSYSLICLHFVPSVSEDFHTTENIMDVNAYKTIIYIPFDLVIFNISVSLWFPKNSMPCCSYWNSFISYNV